MREWQYVYSTCTATVTVTYTNTLREGGKRREWQYVFSTRTATVTVTYKDTLTEWGRGESGSTCTVNVLPQLPEFKITSGLRPISVHFIKTASRNTACSVSVADQSYRMYRVVVEVVAPV